MAGASPPFIGPLDFSEIGLIFPGMIVWIRKFLGRTVGLLILLLSLGRAKINRSGTNADLEEDTQDSTTISETFDE